MADLKQQSHARCQRNALVTSQGKHLQQNTSHHNVLHDPQALHVTPS